MKVVSPVSQLSLFFIFLLLILMPMVTYAEPLISEVRLGLLGHDVDGLWSGSRYEKGTDFNAELVFSPSWPLWGGQVRPNFGITINDSGDTSKVYGGGLWEYSWNNGFFVVIGGGLAVHNGETDDANKRNKKQLGSPVLFRVSFETGFTMAKRHRLSVMFDHVSNGYLADPNDGLDTLGIRYGILF
ncbi:acyloxyacyl hydrolase [Desulfogranum marinum]|uniref:acyloxyacyl hydrolase n=1 Tax=Desulfogranum marinum TaxID=453220 RepID=UPI0029C636B0|nr:acyloxyacyl hydrolase [Desulfogranum marinum]